MPKIRGVEVLVQVKSGSSYVTIGGQKDATLTVDADTIDATTKDEGDWRVYLSGLKTWSVSCDGLYVDGDAAQQALINSFYTGTPVEIKMAKSGTGAFTASGQAIVTHLEIAAAMEDAVTFSVEFQGTGALTLGVREV